MLVHFSVENHIYIGRCLLIKGELPNIDLVLLLYAFVPNVAKHLETAHTFAPLGIPYMFIQ